ncbi:MAG TPA: DUF882 domain-containing protein [Gemmatimonadaceae bacterium]|nr:DUF882 domain-containing protein [Gemmatimonadaceae bacterium]
MAAYVQELPVALSDFTVLSLLLLALETGCGNGRAAPAESSTSDTGHGDTRSISDVRSTGLSYSGTNARGTPRYFTGQLSADAQKTLRDAYGIVDPSHLYISDSSKAGLLKYDPRLKPCVTCYVNSYRIGFVSVRKRGESWDDLQRRLPSLSRNTFSSSALVSTSSISAMDPDVQAEVLQMLAAARRTGFRFHVISTYRSPQQEALLMHDGGGRTHTLTSLHSYGRALDIQIDDGNLHRLSTRRDWIAFRGWVSRFRDDDFRVLGKADQSWDWPHVEMPSDIIGFRSVETAVTAGRECLRRHTSCDFAPHLPSPARTGPPQ